ncbi:Na+/H+ antiporter NhaC [Fictibacillus sp. Mic-4]|uniref:Na+/H+ antiporter NhaC n=1 Tax=Fictibacillus TaxID=1329200 RepID=UPI000415C4C8|nr:Na+/H+ antiporter NhaC [Fictibacillus gelatini]
MNKRMNLPTVLVMFALLFIVMFSSLVFLKVDPHIPLLFCLIVLGTAASFFGASWKTIEKGLLNGINTGLQPMLILFIIGLMISSWMMSGTVPTLLYYGIDVIRPEWFALSALFITILVSTFTGSSLTTVGTVGVALMGIAGVMHVNPGLAAGAIVSGAFFGDKMSPLSDSTNLAPGIVGVNMFDHIRHMMWTTVPALFVTSIIFLFMGHGVTNGVEELSNLKELKQTLGAHFPISPFTLISPFIVMVLAYRRFPIVPTLLAGVLSAVITAFVLIPDMTAAKVMTVLQNGMNLETGNKAVDQIVNKGGLQSMMWSISLIVIALALGGLIKELGMFDLILSRFSHALTKPGSLIAATALSSIGVNLLAGEQYLSALLPGQAFKDVYKKANVPLINLSRTLEDGGTLINPLVPWSVCGAFIASTLGISVLTYLPYAFFLYLSPLFTMILGFTGISIYPKKRSYEEEKQGVA